MSRHEKIMNCQFSFLFWITRGSLCNCNTNPDYLPVVVEWIVPSVDFQCKRPAIRVPVSVHGLFLSCLTSVNFVSSSWKGFPAHTKCACSLTLVSEVGYYQWSSCDHVDALPNCWYLSKEVQIVTSSSIFVVELQTFQRWKEFLLHILGGKYSGQYKLNQNKKKRMRADIDYQVHFKN